MAKRMIDTNIFRDPWFMDLSKDGKLIWIYLFCNCDHAGIYELNNKLLKFESGITDIDKAFEQLGNRCVTVRQGLYFIPKFLYFQYPSFPNSKVKAQDSAIKLLEQNGLFKDGVLRVTQPLDKGYDNDNGYDNGYGCVKKQISERNIIPPKIDWIKVYCKERGDIVDSNKFYDFYESKGWMIGKEKMKDWQASVRTWEKSEPKQPVDSHTQSANAAAGKRFK